MRIRTTLDAVLISISDRLESGEKDLGKAEDRLKDLWSKIHFDPNDEDPKKRGMTTEEKLDYSQALIASAAICSKHTVHRVDRSEKALYVLHLARGEQSDAIQDRTDFLCAQATNLRYPANDEILLEDGKALTAAAKAAKEKQGTKLDEKALTNAFKSYNHLIKRNPNHPWVYYDKGRTLLEIEKLDEAIACFEKAVEINPDNTWTNYSLADALWKKEQSKEEGKKKDFGRVREYLAKSLEKDPQNEYAIALLGNIPESSDLAKILEKLEPDEYTNDDTLLEVGKALSNQGHRESALRYFDALIERTPDHHWVYYNKGHTLNQLGRTDEALECSRKAVDVNPHAYTYGFHASLLREKGKFEEAEQLEKLLSEK